ncbi:tyrosine-protein phosphatase non-receptor type substrate 1-like isoform X2 [Mugil cephalus]|uniref:tyrosine-protein phosphatase non-receptor type substrate 1-like isoform X2 n=1 Tax=Mugil cephalus TaxID=48193 RepID=UPI001FB5FD35|nr:tyrosine-protein phosphatase non-receptor type substrate 1-like isoform X2 [Mugil cephalus]
MSIYVFVVILLVVQTVNGDQPDVEMYSESFNQDAEMILLCRAKSFNTSGIELNIKKNHCDLLTKEDGVKPSGVYQEDNTYWREDFVIVSESEMSNYSCEVIHAESRFHVEKVWDPDSGLKGRIISSRPRVFVSVDNKVQANITLTCLAEGFYPRNIILNIKRNGNILTREDGVETSLDVCPREDNTFQRRDHIIISKSDRSNYSCEVIHAASDSHEEKVWDHHLPPDGFKDKDGDSWHRSAIIAAVIVVLVVVLFLVVVLVLYLRSVPGDRRGRYSDVPQDAEASSPESIKTGESQQSLTVNIDFESSASPGSGDSDNDDTSNNVETEKLRKTNVQDPSEPSNPSTSEQETETTVCSLENI